MKTRLVDNRHPRAVGTHPAGSRGRALTWIVGVVCAALVACAPVVPNRSRPGGAVRWAYELARPSVVDWAVSAELCQIKGVGVGTEGWLPDRGGAWNLTYWSPERDSFLEVSVDSEGRVRSALVDRGSISPRSLPAGWDDSPRVWAATARHQEGTPLSTFEAVLTFDAEPERYPGQAVWRIRYFLQEGGFETHVVTPESEWLTRY